MNWRLYLKRVTLVIIGSDKLVALKKQGGMRIGACTIISPRLLVILFHSQMGIMTYSGTPLIRSPMGQKKIGPINGVTVLTRVFLQENSCWFLTGGQKKWP